MFSLPTSDSTGIVQTLQGLMEQLAAPDLTATEAQTLRSSLWRLVDSIEVGEPDRTCLPADLPVERGVERCVVVWRRPSPVFRPSHRNSRSRLRRPSDRPLDP